MKQRESGAGIQRQRGFKLRLRFRHLPRSFQRGSERVVNLDAVRFFGFRRLQLPGGQFVLSIREIG